MPVDPSYIPHPAFLTIADRFSDPAPPARFPRHVLRFRNQPHALTIGLGSLTDIEWEAHFARFEPLPKNLSTPLAMRYHGHQFRYYNPELGDGRGFLFAQVRGPNGHLLDLATKGTGPTRWSRNGDGRLTLKGGVREVLASELLEARGVRTSKAFSLYETGERLWRNDEPSPTRSSVLVRLGHSHIRFGTFQRAMFLDDQVGLHALTDFVVEHYYPNLADAPDRPAALLGAVARRCARLAADWVTAGFVHGVLNTDNMNINGESFDYGPYRFLPRYDPGYVAAYFDADGLYAFGRQFEAVHWNLSQLAHALSVIGQTKTLFEAIEAFPRLAEAAHARRVVRRLGLIPRGQKHDSAVLARLTAYLERAPVGYARVFFDWWGGVSRRPQALRGPAAPAYVGAEFDAFIHTLEAYQPAQPEALGHRYFGGDRPTTLLYDEIESIWDPIADRDDWSAFEAKIHEIRDLASLLRYAP